MPISKPSLDLEAWTNFLPKERNNDYEYNLLLYKFKSFLHEVMDFHERHKNCSVTRAEKFTNHEVSLNQPPKAFIPTNNSKLNNSTNILINPPPSTPTLAINSPGIVADQKVIDKRAYLKHQHSTPVYNSRDQIPYGSSSEGIARNGSTFSSSYTLNPSNTDEGPAAANDQQLITGSIGRPEIRLRNHFIDQSQRHRINQLSKSTEKLDVTSKTRDDSANHATEDERISSSMIEERATRLKSLNVFKAKLDNNRLSRADGDDEIYDAVSPDDLDRGLDLPPKPPQNPCPPVSSMNRLSISNKRDSKNSLEPSQSNSRGKADISSRSFLYQGNPSSPSVGDKGFDFPKLTKCQFNASSLQSESINDSNSSLSILARQRGKNSNDYSNYVNIDFFLKRNHGPSTDYLNDDDEDENGNHDKNSFDEELDDKDEDEHIEDDDEGDEDETDEESNLESNDLLSNDPLDDLRELSPRELAKKLSSKADQTSSSSMTPSSSGDFLDDPRTSSMIYHPSSSSTSGKQLEAGAKMASFNSMTSNESENSNLRKNSLANQQMSANLAANKHSNQTLWPIHEKKACFANSKQSTSLDQANGLPTDSGNALAEAHNTMRSFLSDLNLSSAKDVFEDKAQRRIVKESFAVEFCGRRKLRHLFLFNDVIVCAKYQASSKQKFTFDVKWYLNLNGISIADLNDAGNHVKYDKEAIENQILAIRTSLILLRGRMQQMKRSKHKQPSKIIKKLKKKRTELEAELVLLLPHLPLVIKHINGKKYTFFLSSNFDRNQWIESIKFLQSQLPATKGQPAATSPSSSELQAWIQTCRKNLNPSLGTFLLRSNCDEDLLYGDMYLHLNSINGITKPGNYYFCFEVDSYGHFSQKASSSVLRVDNPTYKLNEDYIFPLDGAHTLRVLIYEDLGANVKPSLMGKAQIELSHCCYLDKVVERSIVFGNSHSSLTAQFSYVSSELLSIRIPHAKLCPNFGIDITQVCKREKTKVPMIIQLCVNEVERRGMREVGIYRMSGTSTDIQRLKKAFETNPQVAELLLRDIDINSVTGFLKTYLREIPEGLFSNKLYLKFVAAFNIPKLEELERTKAMLELFHKIPVTNQQTIIYLVEHLVKVNKYEALNKMSLTNLATVLGPNILKAPTETSGQNLSDPFTAVVIGSMSQAGILYFFLNRKFANLPLTELDSSEQPS